MPARHSAEEARAAKETAEQVVRAIIDWLQKLPPP
jgi:hypothetical protein